MRLGSLLSYHLCPPAANVGVRRITPMSGPVLSQKTISFFVISITFPFDHFFCYILLSVCVRARVCVIFLIICCACLCRRMFGGDNNNPMFTLFPEVNEFQFNSNASTQLQLLGNCKSIWKNISFSLCLLVLNFQIDVILMINRLYSLPKFGGHFFLNY